MISNSKLYDERVRKERAHFLQKLSFKRGVKILESLLHLHKFFKHFIRKPLPHSVAITLRMNKQA